MKVSIVTSYLPNLKTNDCELENQKNYYHQQNELPQNTKRKYELLDQ